MNVKMPESGHPNYMAWKKFLELRALDRKVALDIDPVTGELACRFTDSKNGQGYGAVPQPYTERWIRMFDTERRFDKLLRLSKEEQALL